MSDWRDRDEAARMVGILVALQMEDRLYGPSEARKRAMERIAELEDDRPATLHECGGL